MHQGGLMLQVEGQNYGMSKQFRTECVMKDHLRENVRRMRQIQRRSREKEAEAQKPVKALWKSEKYANVQSRIKDEIQKEPPPPRPQSACFLRAHSRTGTTVQMNSRPCTPDPSNKLTVPSAASCANVQLKRNNIDFIKSNGISVKHTRMQRSPSLTALDDLKTKQGADMKNYQRGEVPTYLQNRQAQWRQEEKDRIANTPDPAMPPGHRALPEGERQETLGLLRQKEQELVKQLQALPLRTDTLRMRICKKELEVKIAEVEEAIKIFSRPKVFVKVDQ